MPFFSNIWCIIDVILSPLTYFVFGLGGADFLNIRSFINAEMLSYLKVEIT